MNKQTDNNRFFCVNVSKYCGNKSFEVYKPSSLDNPCSNSVMFVMERYIDKANALEGVRECLVFWPEGFEVPNSITDKHAVVLSEYPRKEYNRFFKNNGIMFNPEKELYDLVDNAFICKGAVIGNNCTIMPGAYISGSTVLGDDVYVGAGTKVMGSVSIGNDVVIRENTVIGADGLSTERDDDGTALTMPQFGGVTIGNHVRIGANTVIARGAIDNTVISDGCKIDNSCFVSHNVVLEENVFVVGETLIMGSAHIEKNAYISGNATIRNKLSIGENAFVGMSSVVTKSVGTNKVVFGNPAKEKK